jgi:hypothetical protein
MHVLSKDIYRLIEKQFYNYPRIKRELEKYKREVATSRPAEIGEWGQGRSCHSDPTALKAIKLTTREIRDKEAWLKVIEKVCKHFAGTEKGQFIKLQYFDRLRRNQICEKLFIKRTTYYNWRNSIVYYTALIAQKEDLIDIEQKSGTI